jgi:4-hydroxybenzoate polyprenyltransferase
MNLLERYERRRRWTTWFLWAVGISLALLVVTCAETHTFTIGAPVILVLVALAGFCMLASGKAANDPKLQAVRQKAEEQWGR